MQTIEPSSAHQITLLEVPPLQHLLLTCFDSSFGNLTSLVHLSNALNNADSDSLAHVPNGEAAERRIVGECLNAHRLRGNHLDNGSVTRLNELGGVFDGLAGTTIDLLEELGELAGDVGSVAIENWSVSSTNLTRVVEDDDLGVEGLGTLGGVVLGVTGDVATTDLFDRDILDVEADVVTWKTLDELFVVHLDGLDFGGDTSGSKGNDHAGLDYTGLDTADWYSSNAANLVDILEGKAERLVGRTRWWINGINCLEEGLARGLGLGLLLPSLVPGAVRGDVDHVVTVEAGDRDEWDVLGVVADLLDKVGGLLDNFVETFLRPLGGVHLVDGDNELLNTEGVGEKSVLTGLAILGDTSFELTSTGGDNENGAISLGGTSDHVLDEITMTGGINDGDIVLRGFELPESNVDGDTTFTLSL